MSEESLLNTPSEGAETPDNVNSNIMPTVEALTDKGIHEGIAAAFVGGDYDVLKKVIDEVIAEEIEKRITANSRSRNKLITLLTS